MPPYRKAAISPDSKNARTNEAPAELPKIDFETEGEPPTPSQASENASKIDFIAFIGKVPFIIKGGFMELVGAFSAIRIYRTKK